MESLTIDGDYLRTIRINQGMTQKQLSKKAYLSERQLRTLEKNGHTTLNTVYALSDALECDFINLIKQK